MVELAYLLPIVAVAGQIIYRRMKGIPLGPDRRIVPRVDEEFLQLRIESELPEYSFDGRTAEIVTDGEQRMGDDAFNYTLVNIQRYARNAHGEYFFFLSEGSGKPVFRHVPQETAKVVLGKKYVAPGATGGSLR